MSKGAGIKSLWDNGEPMELREHQHRLMAMKPRSTETPRGSRQALTLVLVTNRSLTV